jgi:hypothetical protein
MKEEIDWDAPDDDVVDFEALEHTEMGTPVKKAEPPKTSPNIESFKNRTQQMSSREEDRKLLVELMFVGEQLKGNLSELQKLDGIAARAAALNEIDTQKIMDRLNSVSFTQIERKIVDTIREDLSKTRDEILTAAGEAEAAAKELTQKTELLKESSDSMLQIDNMADNLEEVSKNIKSWRIKNMYAAIGLSLFFGISATAIVSNIGSLFTSTESIQNAQILTPKFGKIAVLPHKTDPSIFYLAFGSKELTRVETMEENEIKYIVIHSQK